MIVGPDEAASGAVSLKDLRAGGGTGVQQKTVPQSELVEAIRRLLDTHPTTTP